MRSHEESEAVVKDHMNSVVRHGMGYSARRDLGPERRIVNNT
jgi:hypothetical protein